MLEKCKKKKKNKLLGAYSNKIKLLVMILFSLFLVGFVNAELKSYDSINQEVTLKSSFLGIATGDIAKVKLITPLVYYVPSGYQKIAEFEVTSYKDYDNFISQIEFYNIKNAMSKINVDYDFKIKYYENVTIDKTKEDCDAQKYCDKIQYKLVERWTDFDKYNIKDGDSFTIGIFTEVKKGDNVEWIPTIAGLKIDEWASYIYTADLDYRAGATCGYYWYLGNVGGDYRGYAQAFVPTETINLTNISFYLMLTGIPAFNINFSITNSTSYVLAHPSATQIISGTSDTVNAVQHIVNFSGGFMALGGTTYYIMLGHTGAGANNNYGACTQTPSVYAGGTVYTYASSSWTQRADDDSFFAVFGAEEDTGPALYVPNVTLKYPANSSNISNSNLFFQVDVYNRNPAGYIDNVTLYLNDAVDQVNTTDTFNATYNFTKTLSDGRYNWSILAYDNYSKSNQTLTRFFTLDTTKPIINLTNPTATTYYTNLVTSNKTDIYLNWTISDLTLNMCWFTNITSGLNETNTCNNNQTFKNKPFDSYTFYVYGNDSVNNIATSSVTASYKYKIFEVNQTFDSTTLEENLYNYSANIDLNDFAITSLYFSYDGVNYSASYQVIGDYIRLYKYGFSTPSVTTDTNKTITWYIGLSDGSTIKLSDKTQLVQQFSVGDCTTYSILVYNFTMLDEKTQEVIPATAGNKTPYAELSLDFKKFGTSTIVSNFSTSFNGVNPFSVCTNTSLTGTAKLSVYGVIRYEDVNNTELGKVSEFYNIQNFTLTNTTMPQHINLYDLDNLSSTEFTITYKDSNLVPVSDAIIQVHRKYIAEGIYKIVEIPITDSNGKTLAHLETSDAVYSYYVYKYGVLLASFTDRVEKCDSLVLEECNINLNALRSSQPLDQFITLGDFTFSLKSNSTSRTATAVFIIPSGSGSNVVLNATILGTLVCSDSSVLNADTLTCTIPNNYKNQTAMVRLWNNGQLVGTAEFDLRERSKDVFNGSQVFILIILYLMIFGIALSDNPMVTGIIMVLGMILALAVNVIDSGSGSKWIGAGATLLWFIIAMVLVLIKAGRRT